MKSIGYYEGSLCLAVNPTDRVRIPSEFYFFSILLKLEFYIFRNNDQVRYFPYFLTVGPPTFHPVKLKILWQPYWYHDWLIKSPNFLFSMNWKRNAHLIFIMMANSGSKLTNHTQEKLISFLNFQLWITKLIISQIYLLIQCDSYCMSQTALLKLLW